MLKKSFKYIVFLYKYIKNYKKLFSISFLLLILTSGGTLLGPIIFAHIIDVSVPKNDIKDMVVYGIIFVIVLILTAIMSYFQTIFITKLGLNIITKIKQDLFNHILKLPISFFDSNPVGELMAKVESDSERVKGLFSEFAIIVLKNLLFFIGVISILFIKNRQIAIYFLIITPFLFIMSIGMVKFLNKYYRKVRKLYADISATLAEYIPAVNIIQIFNQQENVEKKLDEKSKTKLKAETTAYFLEYSFFGFYIFLVETVFVSFVILSLAPKIISGVITIGTLVIFVRYTMRILEPLTGLAENITFFQRAIVSLERIYNLYHLPEEEVGPSDITIKHFDHSIKFENVWFKYKKDEWVLKNINFEIKKGEKIALVGSSGSGKTTIISLLCGFYKVTSGKILIDGKDINTINLYDWRKKIGLVLQDIFMFPGNIIENVRIYNDDITEKEVLDAIDKVQFKKLLENGNKNIYSELSEKGSNISMGERQLLSFARSIVFSPEIIILDEATSSVDAKTESLIQETMEKTMKNKTVIIVAHRLSTILDADKIILLDKGKILAIGNHFDLLKQSDQYRNLVELQFLHKQQSKEETL